MSRYSATFKFTLEWKIPDGIDINDKTQVASVAVIYSTLYITLVNGKTIEVEEPENRIDYDKYPDEQGLMMENEEGSMETEEASIENKKA
jgi:hypothetical protein